MATLSNGVWWGVAIPNRDYISTVTATGAIYGSTYPKATKGVMGIVRVDGKAVNMPENCKNCAAPLDWLKERCDYCRTFFVNK